MSEYKKIELTVDDVIGEAAKSIADMIMEAKVKALKEGIKANTVFIDKHFAKVNAFSFVFNYNILSLPPMICGLEIQPTDELPDGYDFAVFEAPETERERLYKKAKSEAADEIIFDLACKLNTMLPCKIHPIPIDGKCEGNSYDLGKEHIIGDILKYLSELKKKYTEGEK